MTTAVLAVVPDPLFSELFSDDDVALMVRAAEAVGGAFARAERLDDAILADARILVTSWGMPPIDAELLARMPRLELVAHIGASVRPFATDELFARGVRVTQAGAAMARPVAEVSLAFTLALLHRIPRMDHALRGGAGWARASDQGPQHEILDAAVTVVGASRTGRAYLELVRLLGARTLVVDPTLDEAAAASLGAELVTLDEGLRRARILALHAPSLPETRHMIGARELALLPDGAGVVNTARSWLVNGDDLVAELRTGRIDAAIDVFDEEPLPAGHPLRSLDGVLLTPHRAAGTVEGRRRQGSIVASEIAAFAGGGPLAHEITPEQLENMA